MNDALPLECLCFGVNRGGIHRVDEKKNTVQRILRHQPPRHTRHQAHQPTFTATAHGSNLLDQQAMLKQCVMRAAGCMQVHAQRTQTGFTRASPTQQAAVRAKPVQPVGYKSKVHGGRSRVEENNDSGVGAPAQTVNRTRVHPVRPLKSITSFNRTETSS